MILGYQWRVATVLQMNKPSLKLVSPIVYASCITFAILNIVCLAPAFFVADSTRGLVLVGEVPSYLWGLVFLSLGCIMLAALYTNTWWLVKRVLGIGLVVKSMFAWALVFTLFASIANIGVVGLWFGLMIWQALCIIFFTPEFKE